MISCYAILLLFPLDFTQLPIFNFTSIHEQEEWLSVGQVKAVDMDLNAKIKYDMELIPSCSRVSRDSLRIDAQTGIVEAKTRILDREACERLELKISASDGKNVAHSRMYINLLDLNDSPPKFAKESFLFKLSEGALFKKYFGKVIATDMDKANTSYSQVSYAMLESTDDSMFAIEAGTGHLMQLKPLDYETKTSYELKIVAYDNLNASGNSLSAMCVIRIEVIDVNDNRPVFSWPVDADKHMLVTLNVSESGTDSFKLNATDSDTNQNGKIVYTIEKQIKLKQKADDKHNGKQII